MLQSTNYPNCIRRQQLISLGLFILIKLGIWIGDNMVIAGELGETGEVDCDWWY